MQRIRGYAQVLGILALEIIAIVVLRHISQNQEFRIPWHSLSTWFSTTELQTLLASSACLLGLVVAYYLAITTALYTLASLLRVEAATRLLRFITLPAVRHSLDKALAATALTVTLVGATATFASADTGSMFPPQIVQTIPGSTTTTTTPSTPTTTPSTSSTQDDNQSSTADLFPQSSNTTVPQTTTTILNSVAIPGLGDTTATTTQTPSSLSTSSSSSSAAQPPTSVEGEQIYNVVPGDNLWTISKQHLADTRGVDPSTLSDHDIARYWLRVIDENKDNLRSGNPNLIFPNEQITLPDAS